MASQFNPPEKEEQERELSLCLSLGGIYSKEVPLLRSSSVAAGDTRRKDSPEVSLPRTCSLPASPPTQNCLQTQVCSGHELGSATRAEPSLRPRQVVEAWKKRKGAVRSWREVTERMPSVTTTGEGPNGKRVEGFLYKYTKGGHVSIVCVCHGSFLTPAEFVRHAGSLDDHNPMRRIHVTHTPLPF